MFQGFEGRAYPNTTTGAGATVTTASAVGVKSLDIVEVGTCMLLVF